MTQIAFETSELIKRCSYIDMLTALPDATNDLTLPCHEQRAGAATAHTHTHTHCTGNLTYTSINRLVTNVILWESVRMGLSIPCGQRNECTQPAQAGGRESSSRVSSQISTAKQRMHYCMRCAVGMETSAIPPAYNGSVFLTRPASSKV